MASVPVDLPPASTAATRGREAVAVPASDDGESLVDGMRMDVEEFSRRYAAMREADETFHAELIFGVVYTMQPPSAGGHGIPHAADSLPFLLYDLATPGVTYSNPAGFPAPTTDGKVEPDGCLFVEPSYGGRATLDESGNLTEAPELCIEIANTTVYKDLVTKRALYEAAGVQEYLVHVVQESRVAVFVRRDDRLVPADTPDAVFRSETFPGLWLDLQALQTLDKAAARQTLEQGLASEPHVTFVAELAARRAERATESPG